MGDKGDTSQIPDWLTHEYLGKIFSDFVNREKVSKEIIEWDVEISPFSKDLDSLATVLFRVKVTNTKNVEQTYSAFVKILSYTGSNNFQFSLEVQEKLFKREGKFYEDFLSEASKLCKKIDGFNLKFPQLYHFSMDPMVLIIEDLNPKGFDTNLNEYSLSESEIVFENIARYHALSYYMNYELNIDMSVYTNFMAKEQTTDSVPLPLMAYKLYTNVVSTWEGCGEFVEKLKKFEPHYCESLNKIEENHKFESTFFVLSHGDCHKRNFLFSNNMKECAMIDHQMISWISPAYDLIGAFNTFCNPEDNVNSRDYFVKCYHREFKAVLKKLGFYLRIPTLFDVQKEVLRYGLIDIIYWSVHCPLQLMDFSPDSEKSYVERYIEGMNNPNLKELSKLFPTFMHRGYLDCDDED